MVNVEAGGQALSEKIRLGERGLPALGVLPVGNAQAHILTAAEEVRLGVRELGQKALRGRIAAAEADRAGRLILDLDDDDHAIGAGAWPVRDMDLLEVAQTVKAPLGALDQHVIIGVAFADIEFAANDVVPGARVADNVDALDIDFRTVVHRELQRNRMVDGVAIAVRARLREGVALARDVARDRIDRLVDRACVVDVARLQSDESSQRRPVHLRYVGDHRNGRHVVLGALVHRDGDHVAWRIGLVDDVGIDDAEIGVAVLHVIAADRLLVGGQTIGIIDIGALEPRQEVHRAWSASGRAGGQSETAWLPTNLMSRTPVLPPSLTVKTRSTRPFGNWTSLFVTCASL